MKNSYNGRMWPHVILGMQIRVTQELLGEKKASCATVVLIL